MDDITSIELHYDEVNRCEELIVVKSGKVHYYYGKDIELMLEHLCQ